MTPTDRPRLPAGVGAGYRSRSRLARSLIALVSAVDRVSLRWLRRFHPLDRLR
jgi:hypothetical protein